MQGDEYFMDKYKLINFKILGDERGQLVVFEENDIVPFTIKRVFCIYGTKKNISRGNHAHYKTKQFLVTVNGSCKITLSNGKEKKTFLLDSPNLGLLQDTLIWGSMHDFSDDCVLLVLASEHYDEKDYIRDYNKFLEIIK